MNVNKYDRIDTAIEFIRNIANEKQTKTWF